MELVLPGLLRADEVAILHALLVDAPFTSGLDTAGALAARIKHNLQLDDGAPAARRATELVLAALRRSPTFTAAAMPRATTQPRVNRYQAGMRYGPHVDHGLMGSADGGGRLRGDLSATLFLSAPEAYDGGELVIIEPAGERRFKLGAGDLLLYQASTIHRVEPVTRGTRDAVILWIESLVASAAQRAILFTLDRAILALASRDPDAPELLAFSATYHNLLRSWAVT